MDFVDGHRHAARAEIAGFGEVQFPGQQLVQPMSQMGGEASASQACGSTLFILAVVPRGACLSAQSASVELMTRSYVPSLPIALVYNRERSRELHYIRGRQSPRRLDELLNHNEIIRE